MCNRALEQKITDNGLESIILEGINQFNYLKKLLQLSNDKIFEILKTYEPFNNEEIFGSVKERIDNAR